MANRFNPILLKYTDLIRFLEQQEKFFERSIDTARVTTRVSGLRQHQLECTKSILKLLRKYEKNRQLDLEMEFKKMKQ